MDISVPLVVDNGTGVCFHAYFGGGLLTSPFFQFVKVGYAGSNFPEHGAHPTSHLVDGNAYRLTTNRPKPVPREQFFLLSSVDRFCAQKNV